jgi:hypothetical protein
MKMTRQEMMAEAHKLAKTYEGDYTACLALAMRELQRGGKEMEKEILTAEEQFSIINNLGLGFKGFAITNGKINHVTHRTNFERSPEFFLTDARRKEITKSVFPTLQSRKMYSTEERGIVLHNAFISELRKYV